MQYRASMRGSSPQKITSTSDTRSASKALRQREKEESFHGAPGCSHDHKNTEAGVEDARGSG